MILQSATNLQFTPKRIVSLVPSQTELLHNLGLEEETIGITKFCVHPAKWFKTKTKVGGTKKINIELVKVLKPDLIIANKEENVKAEVEELAEHFPVWVTDVNNAEDALQMIDDIGELTRKKTTAEKLITEIKENFSKLADSLQLQTKISELRTCYLIWRNPYMTIGGDTFINDMLSKCGFKNIFEEQKRYPEVTISELQAKHCELLLLSSEPFPFKQKHIDELQYELPNCKIILVDGEMFSWYGSRLLLAAEYFLQLRQSLL